MAITGEKGWLAKHTMSDHEYRTYKKTHPYEHVLDEEEAKVKRERGRYAKLKKIADKKLKDRLYDLAQIEDDEDLDDELGFQEEFEAQRELRNATGHKSRLKDLERRES
jgi:hypothetical protein